MIDNSVEFADSQMHKKSKLDYFRNSRKNTDSLAFFTLPETVGIFKSKLKVDLISAKACLIVRNNPLKRQNNAFLKRAFDIVISSLVIVFILSWLVPLLAVLIKRDSSGPVFYKQKRTGRNNKTFQCFKFRTMSYEKNAQFIAATKNDLRVTKIGRFLRKTSLDEFPQFFNVLLGDMSIVGPRPHPIKLNEDYQNKVEKYMLRHIIKPGITGLAQAKGYRGEVSSTLTMRQRIKIDIFYVENWSMWLDIKIIMLTALNIVQGDKNAY